MVVVVVEDGEALAKGLTSLRDMVARCGTGDLKWVAFGIKTKSQSSIECALRVL